MTHYDIVLVAGTRPEIIKLAPVMSAMDELGLRYALVWSGQHYDYELSEVFFQQLGVPRPVANLGVGSGSHAEQTSKIMHRLEGLLKDMRPSVVAALGDTNTVLAAALTSAKMLIPFAHIEAGLRSWDRTMPEEINRVVADSVAELLLAPTKLAAINLLHEGRPVNKIRITGNTIVDVVLKYKNVAKARAGELLEQLGIEPEGYLLLTVHRAENTDDPNRLASIISAIKKLSRDYRVIFPAHPRTVKRMQEYSILEAVKDAENIIMTPPVGYFEFLGLLINSLLVLTDSGGVQEEAFTLGIPTVTLRYNTERPETVLFGGNVLAGPEEKKIIELAHRMITQRDDIRKRASSLPNPLGDGWAGRRIASEIKKAIEGDELRIRWVDTRDDPFVTYAIIGRWRLGEALSATNAEVTAMYDEQGVATSDMESCASAVIRAPISRLREFLRGIVNHGEDSPNTQQ